MNSKRLTILLPVLVVLTMLASLITPAPVLAAGEPPPPPGEKSTKAPVAAPAKPAPPASDASFTAEAPAEMPDGVASAAAVALNVDAIAQAGAVLVGPSGNPLPLAAQETVDVLGAVGDVYFKGSGGIECGGGWCKYDTIAHALSAFSTNHGTGTIYASGALIEPGPVDVVNTLALNLSKLTGLAWNGTSNYTPRLTGGLLTIQNMLKGFTVDGFYIGQGIDAHDNAGTLRLQNLYVTNPAGTGISVTRHKGNIDLFNVTISNTGGDGANLDNCIFNIYTHKCDGTGNVTLSNSSFNANQTYGVRVFTTGSALLERVEGNDNPNNYGARLSAWGGGATVKDSRFNGNLYGLSIQGGGAIKLQNVEAVGNTYNGVDLSGGNDITVNGGFFAGNSGEGGLEALTAGGNITLNNIRSRGNKYSVLASNYDLFGPVKTVTVTNSSFSGTTSGDGLQVYSKGNVTLNHINADGNHGSGVSIDNAQFVGSTSNTYYGSGSVSLLNSLGPNQFINNSGAAITAKSKGPISLKGVFSTSNSSGILLDGCAPDPNPPHNCQGKGNITLSALQVEETTTGYGLTAGTGGAISLDKGRFNGNYDGVYLHNTSVSAAKPVTVTNSVFANTMNPNSVGLEAWSKGNITVNNVQAVDNQGAVSYAPVSQFISGILPDNCLYVGSACTGSGTVSVLSSLGASKASGNTLGEGLSIFSHGAVTVSGFSSTNNGGGAYIDNTPGAGTLTITKSTFSNNTGAQGGLMAYSARAITLNGVQADANPNGYGVEINNCLIDCLGSGNVSILSTLGPNSMSSNQYGLWIESAGSVLVNGATASNNSNWILGVSGVWIQNYYTPGKTVTVNQGNFNYNNGTGLYVKSAGVITLNNIGASSNLGSPGNGLFLRNDGFGVTPGVNILSTSGINQFNGNTRWGLYVSSNGNITLSKMIASDNGAGGYTYSGAYLGTSDTRSVTITCSAFNHNANIGLEVAMGTGTLTFKSVAANYNNGGGDDFYLNGKVPVMSWTVCGH
jgi:hypothetical protein